ncbi:MAG: S9 family peptidase [Acidobacteriota bacterium]
MIRPFRTVPWLAVLALILLLPAGALEAGVTVAEGGLTPNDLAELRSVGDVAVAPGGETVAYTLRVPRTLFDQESGRSWTELHVIDGEGNSRPFITGETSVGGIGFTNEGDGITFVSKRGDDDNRDLWVIPLAGGEARKLVDFETSVSEYTFSPDGRWVAFLASEPEDEAVEDLADDGFNQEVYEEDWGFTRVYVQDLEEGGEPRQLELEGSASELHWSPEGTRIAVALQPTPSIDDRYMARQVNVVDAASGEVQLVLPNSGKLDALRWSPDGKRLALLVGEDIHDPIAGRLAIASTSGEASLQHLTNDFEGDVEAIEWLDNETLLAKVAQGVEDSLQRISLAGEFSVVEAPGQACLNSFVLAADGSYVAVAHTPSHPEEVYRGKAGSGLERVSTSNDWLEDRRLGRQEVLRYTARDGATVEALLIHPLDKGEGPTPLIVNVHGGPEAHYCNGWNNTYSNPGQTGAAFGFAVVYPNYRGSTGRGTDWAKQHQQDPAGKEFDDLVDAVDHLVKAGVADKAKVGITGGSYGGFASAWGATAHTEHYAASVMNVGISDQISKFGTTDIPNEIVLVHQRIYIWEDWQFFLERSPIYYVEQARTPILILHGKEDTRVSPSQSLELYRALKVLGKVPVRHIRYPGEGHGNQKSAGRYDYSLRQLRWFVHYLQGEGGDAPAYPLNYEAALEGDWDKAFGWAEAEDEEEGGE